MFNVTRLQILISFAGLISEKDKVWWYIATGSSLGFYKGFVWFC